MAITNKKNFITLLLHERDMFELFLNRVGYARRMTLKGAAGKHSIKDILAHIWAYEQFIADRMHEIVNDQTYTPCKTDMALDAFLDEFGYPDFGSPLLGNDAPKEWVVEHYTNVSLDDVIAQELEAFSSIITSLEMMSESAIHSHNLYNRIAKHTFEQYRKYMLEIKHWLKKNGIQLK